MPCYQPLPAALVDGREGRHLVFARKGHPPPKGKAISLPCGRCIGCRLERARQWAVRIVHESKMHEESCFISMTFNDESVPKDGSLDVPTCQSFLKKLRARLAPTKIRFFLCGEYGEERQRPHYHAIIFGWVPTDLKRLKKRGEFVLYSSEFLAEVWGMGFVSVGNVTFDSACYVANYATKKVTGEKAKDHYRGRRPEFLLMSRRPGIGAKWIEAFMSDVYPCDEVISRGKPSRPPRYYDLKFQELDPEGFEAIRVRREGEAEKLEDLVLKGGAVVKVAPSRNAHRLVVRKTVAEAKARLKARSLT